MTVATNGDNFEPRIVGFLCNWCSYTGADLAGTSRMKSAPNLRIIRVMCTGRVDPSFILRAFQLGADGVLVAGCHPGDCHYQEGNFKALRRVTFLKRMLKELGIDERRLRLEWISASEGEKFAKVSTEFTEHVRALGPLRPEAPRPAPAPGETRAGIAAGRAGPGRSSGPGDIRI